MLFGPLNLKSHIVWYQYAFFWGHLADISWLILILNFSQSFDFKCFLQSVYYLAYLIQYDYLLVEECIFFFFFNSNECCLIFLLYTLFIIYICDFSVFLILLIFWSRFSFPSFSLFMWQSCTFPFHYCLPSLSIAHNPIPAPHFNMKNDTKIFPHLDTLIFFPKFLWT